MSRTADFYIRCQELLYPDLEHYILTKKNGFSYVNGLFHRSATIISTNITTENVTCITSINQRLCYKYVLLLFQCRQ